MQADIKDLSFSKTVLLVMMLRAIYEWQGHKRINVPRQWSTICRSERGGRIWSSTYHFILTGADVQLRREKHTNDAADALLENI